MGRVESVNKLWMYESPAGVAGRASMGERDQRFSARDIASAKALLAGAAAGFAG